MTVRKAIAAGLLPVIVAVQQTFTAQFSLASACEPFATSLVPRAGARQAPGVGAKDSEVVVTLATGVVIASHAVLVTATVCGSRSQLIAPSAVAVRVDIAGSAGRFTIATGWARAGGVARP